MSDTPLTDKHCDFGNVGPNGERIIVESVPAEFARTLERDLAQARAALDARWLPIDQAPEDGRGIITCNSGFPNSVGESYWDKNASGFRDARTRELIIPTHYMPLPQPPPARSAEGARG